jgi:hypothetical protein
MATTTNFGWSTPDDSANVKDGASAIRSLGTAVDTTMATMVPKTVVDAKGDLIAATAADTVARLAVGANNTVLTADSAETTGLKWASVSAGGMTSLLTGSFSTSTTSITSIPSGYKELVVIARDVVFSNNTSMRFRFNNVSTSVYAVSAHNVSTNAVQNGGPGATSIDLSAGSTLEATRGNNFEIRIPEYADSRKKYCNIVGYMTRPGNSPIAFSGVGFIDSTTSISSIQFFVDNNTFSSGTYIVYGVN